MNTNQIQTNMKLDIKTIMIIVLGSLLVFNLILKSKETPIDNKGEIKSLHESNEKLNGINNSLNDSIKTLNKDIIKINEMLNLNNNKILELKLQIQKLKDEKNKIQPTVNRMSANVIANTFSNYLDKK
jgi:predicted nuclease with TOPRIM domain